MRTPIAAALVLAILIVSPAAAQTRITRAATSNVRIQTDGKAIPLTLEGQNLTAVSGVRVLRDGRPVTGVTAVVRQTAATRLVVELVASGGVPAGDYTLELVAGRERIAVPASMLSVVIAQASDPRMRRIEEPRPAPTRQMRAGGTIPTPVVARATPATVQLQVGGPPATVVLAGTLLDRVTRARVLRNGRNMIGMRAELIGTSATQREIRLTATAGMSPPFDVPLDLVLDYRMGTSPLVAPEPMTTPVRVTVAAPPPVDLSIASCGTMQPARPREARITIRNTGTEGAAFQARQTIAAVTVRGTTRTVTAPGGGMFIPAGGTVDVTGFIDPLPEGSSTLAWTVDPQDLIPESNPSNNTRNCAVTITAPPQPPAAELPDLVIPVITVQPNSGPAGTTFRFRITVRNVGAGTAGSGTSQLVRCTIDGVPGGGTVTNAPYRTLRTGDVVVHEVRVSTTNFVPGTKRFECTVDRVNDLAESVENNNTRAVTFTVTAGR